MTIIAADGHAHTTKGHCFICYRNRAAAEQAQRNQARAAAEQARHDGKVRYPTDEQRRQAYEKSGGVLRTGRLSKRPGTCALCGNPMYFWEMQVDHIVPWSKGGLTLPNNLQATCTPCNLKKGDK